MLSSNTAISQLHRRTGTGQKVYSRDISFPTGFAYILCAETNVQTSPLFVDYDPLSGLGGWGNASDDYSLTNGGFKDFRISYPIPHRLRRQYTPQGGGGFPGGGGGGGGANGLPSTFSASYISSAVNGNAGNFTSFQNAIENVSVGQYHAV